MNISVLKKNILSENYFHLKDDQNYVGQLCIKIHFICLSKRKMKLKKKLPPRYTKICLKLVHFFCLKWSPIVFFHHEWVKDVVHGALIDLRNLKDIDRGHLCHKPSQVVVRFTRIKAYGNHFKVTQSKNELL